MYDIKAIICTKYGPPEVLELKEVKKPVSLKNEICIKVFSTSVTASDCIIRGFKVPAKFYLPMSLAIGFKRPRTKILGMVFSGEVESVGKNVKSFSKGDKVYGLDRFKFGAYAEYKCIKEDGLVIHKSSRSSYEEAAAIPYGGLLALHFLRKGNVHQNQKILIYGASGAIGTSAIQIAKYFRADVTAVCSTSNLELVKNLGADKVIDYTINDFTKYDTKYDLIFNAVGKNKAILNCSQVLKKDGKNISVDDGTPKFYINDLTFLNELIEKGYLKSVIDRSYKLDQIVEAHTYVDKGHKKGNVIINVE